MSLPTVVNFVPSGKGPGVEGGNTQASQAGSMTYFRLASTNNPESSAQDDLPLLEDDLTTTLLPESALSPRVVSLQSSWNYFRRLGNFLYSITIMIMLVVVPWVMYSALRNRRVDVAAYKSAEVMVVGTLVLSFRLVYLHLTHWYMPQVQKYVVRILWMVPLYSFQSYMSLRHRNARLYIETIRDLYEAFVIASFVYYCIELLGGQDGMVRILQAKRTTAAHLGKHNFPVNLFLEPWDLGLEFTLQCKHGVLQYVVIKTIATVLTCFFEIIRCYGEGEFKWDVAYPYLAFTLNTSVMYALYCLMMLFHAVHEELCHPINWRPLGKFLCIKGVVFFTWWQGVLIFYFKSKGYISDTGGWSGDDIANALIDYCVCFEMVLFALAHSFTFSYKEYLPSRFPPELQGNTGTLDTQLDPPAASIPGQNSADGSNHSGDSNESGKNRKVNMNYRPPAVLHHPMTFSDAFWSSTIPIETITDIRRLRTGVDSVINGIESPGAISLQDMDTAYQRGLDGGESQQSSAVGHGTTSDVHQRGLDGRESQQSSAISHGTSSNVTSSNVYQRGLDGGESQQSSAISHDTMSDPLSDPLNARGIL